MRNTDRVQTNVPTTNNPIDETLFQPIMITIAVATNTGNGINVERSVMDLNTSWWACANMAGRSAKFGLMSGLKRDLKILTNFRLLTYQH